MQKIINKKTNFTWWKESQNHQQGLERCKGDDSLSHVHVKCVIVADAGGRLVLEEKVCFSNRI